MRLFSLLADNRLAMGVLLLASLALPVLVAQASAWRMAGDAAGKQLALIRQQADLESTARERLARWRQAQEQWELRSAQAERLGWRTDLWDLRSVEVGARRFSRLEADTLIASLAFGPDAFMLPRSFSLKATGDKGSLFIASPELDQRDAIQLSLSGDYYSRRMP